MCCRSVLPIFLMMVSACAAVHKGPILFKSSVEILPEMIHNQTNTFNEVMECNMIQVEFTKDKLVKEMNGVNTITQSLSEDLKNTSEQGRMSRYHDDEVDISFNPNEQGKIYSWVIYHEYAHAIGVDHTEDPCDIMWSPEHPLWQWHAFKCSVTDATERLKLLKKRIGDTGKEYCPEVKQ